MPATTTSDFRRETLGDILVRVGVITGPQLQEALKQSDSDQKNLGQILVALGFATEEKIIKAVSIRLGIPYFTSFEGLAEPGAAKALPESLARRHLAVPIFKSDDTLTVGMVNPIDIHAIDEISNRTGLRVAPVMTTLSNLFDAIQKAYGTTAVEALAVPTSAVNQVKDKIVRLQAEEKSVIEVVNSILQEAMTRKASDIHLEPAEKLLRVRFRVDGMLQEGRSFGKDMEMAILARVKILSKLDITETRLPQDGHLRFEFGGRAIDVRVSTLPTVHGEKGVLRVLDSSKALKNLRDLGLSEGVLKSFAAAIKRPHGIILVTGPTGSGKTSTLYAALSELNEKYCNIVTLEDPVEYHIDGINQMETHSKIGLTFAAGLRSVLRQDPNIILVGEIRDFETAEIAIQAAITGHLVFSTLHTNDAVSAVHRLINMKAEPFLIAASLGGVMAQRLVRRLCDKCKCRHELSAAEIEALGKDFKDKGPFFEAPGCQACFKTGFSGRFAIHEWLGISRKIRELILRRASTDELLAAARSEGMRTLQEDALGKASSGLTTLAEVIRVTREEREE